MSALFKNSVITQSVQQSNYSKFTRLSAPSAVHAAQYASQLAEVSKCLNGRC